MKIKCVHSRVKVDNLASTRVPFTLTTVEVPNVALTHKKWIIVWGWKITNKNNIYYETKHLKTMF